MCSLLIILIFYMNFYILYQFAVQLLLFQYNSMIGRNRQAKSVWRRKRSQYSASALLSDDPSFSQLKSMSKRLAIISRLEKKQTPQPRDQKVSQTYSKLDLDYQSQPNIQKKQQKRPCTTKQTRKLNNFRSVKEAFNEQKKINEYLIAEKHGTTAKTALSTGSATVKEGLLGEYDRYSQMSKQQLIEKLISLEFLANNIFRKNKVLEEKIKILDPNYKFN